MTAELSDQITVYNYFRNKDEEEVDYLIMGPGISRKKVSPRQEAQDLFLSPVRKDCVGYLPTQR